MWFGCHVPGVSGPTRIAWPDGGSYLEQPEIVVSVFALINSIASDMSEAEAHRSR